MASTLVEDLLAAAGTPAAGPSVSREAAARALAEGRVLDVHVWSSMGDSEASIGPAATLGLDAEGRVHPRFLVFPRPIPPPLRRSHREDWWESVADVYASFGVAWPPPPGAPPAAPAPPAPARADLPALAAVFESVRAHLARPGHPFLYSALRNLARFRHDAYLPEHWRAWLRAYRPVTGELRATDFDPNGTIRLRFEDGSEARFEYAFCAVDEGRGELAVFTEHCGYHVFGLGGLEYEGPTVALPDGAG